MTEYNSEPYVYHKTGYIELASKATDSIFSSFGFFPNMNPVENKKPSGARCIFRSSTINMAIGSFELVDHENKDTRTEFQMPEMSREGPLTLEEWRSQNLQEIQKRIFYGGVDKELRCDMWKYLLGYWPWDSTEEERVNIRKEKEKEYFIIKNQWLSITTEQASHFSKYVSRVNKIEKDVLRTERNHPCFHEPDSIYLKNLRDILITYSFFNWDVGYSQGMNDLLVPILLVQYGDEVDSFWCFKLLMDRYGHSYYKDQSGIRNELERLEKLISLLDPLLHKYLSSVDAVNLYFCYRWILLVFKREFVMQDVFLLWEAFFSKYLHPEFHLFFSLAILIRYRSEIMFSGFNFDDILLFISTLSLQLKLPELFSIATALVTSFDTICDEDVKKSIFG
eukprot:TRINITY_DN4901_c0_g2_i2.p1 TRINITY_DN4901_c0_g2~~TRINITY_DN4901_c0_g2_i2.p1  ORF type:complete len:394 (-),score=81.64 TRINITY_DN4901_c0_g2_i2:189-1370(-)